MIYIYIYIYIKSNNNSNNNNITIIIIYNINKMSRFVSFDSCNFFIKQMHISVPDYMLVEQLYSDQDILGNY